MCGKRPNSIWCNLHYFGPWLNMRASVARATDFVCSRVLEWYIAFIFHSADWITLLKIMNLSTKLICAIKLTLVKCQLVPMATHINIHKWYSEYFLWRFLHQKNWKTIFCFSAYFAVISIEIYYYENIKKSLNSSESKTVFSPTN